MRPYSPSQRRRGTALIIVISFLLLLFVLALTFVFYSTAESDTTRVYRDYANVSDGRGDDGGSPPDPNEIFNSAFGQLIYGVPDDESGAHNSLRGHDMARLVYGRAPGFGAGDPTPSPDQPYNGVGFGTRPTDPLRPQTVHPWLPNEAREMIHYIWHSNATFPTTPATVGQYLANNLIDIDNTYERNPKTNSPPFTAVVAANAYRYYAKNANHTHPDANNLFLAKLDPTSGRVIVPSLHRPWLMKDPFGGPGSYAPPPYGPGDPLYPNYPNPLPLPITGLPTSPNPADPNPWTNAWGRLLTLRPRPVDHQWPPGSGVSYFPYPILNIDSTTGQPLVNPDGTKSYGDLQNMDGIPGGKFYDSVWVDPDLPVRRWQGKNYKPLVSFLVLDLDGRVNLNTAGNFYPLPVPDSSPPQYGQGSNQGVGPWEVNPAHLMTDYFTPPLLPMYPQPPYTRLDTNGAAMLTRRPFLNKPPGPGPNYRPYSYNSPVASNRYGGLANPNVFGGVPDKRFRPSSNDPTLNMPAFASMPHFYSQFDFNGFSPRSLSPFRYSDQSTGAETGMVFGKPYQGQAMPAGNPPHPDLESPYDSGQQVAANMSLPQGYDERTDHPSLYSPYMTPGKGVSNKNAPNDRAFGVEELRYLNLKYNKGDFSKSDLAALAPLSLGNQNFNFGQKNARFLTTPFSADFNRPGASPWLTAAISGTYNLPATPGATPRGTPGALSPTSVGGPLPANADHDTAYRASLAVLGPVDINRKLADYRLDTTTPYSRDNMGNEARAVQDRQQLAKDVFDRLLMVTMGKISPPGIPGLAIPATPFAPGPTYSAERWLAQLAVNIVDYLDADDLMTPFLWNQAGPLTDQYVFGFERPRVVMNETYVRLENSSMNYMPHPTTLNNTPATDPATMQPYPYHMRVWMELHNPLTPRSQGEQDLDPMGYDPGGVLGGYRARLAETSGMGGPQSAYQLLIYKVQLPSNTGADPLGLQAPTAGANPTGTPGQGGTPLPMTTQLASTVQFTGAGVTNATGTTLQPNVGTGPPTFNGGTYANENFYVLGPAGDGMGGAATLPGAVPAVTANLTHNGLQIDVPSNEVDMNNRPTWVPAFVLQRLANPYLPNNPLTNPFVTVDYLDPDNSPTGVSVYDRVEARFNGAVGPNPPMEMRPDVNTTFSWGRRQPYDGRVNFNIPGQFRQGGAAPGAMGQLGGHTFKTHNARNGGFPAAGATTGTTTDQSPGTLTAGGNDTLQYPFLPLVHMDRPALSPADLLHVTAAKPHELTHQFHMLSPTARKLAFTADWFDEAVLPPAVPGQSSFLFRALDYLRTPHAMAGIPNGGRVPGRVNLNTMPLLDTLRAVADAKRLDDPYDQRVSQNRFADINVQAAWQALMGGGPAQGRDGTPGWVSETDRPFKGLAVDVATAGQPAGANSMDRTFVRNGGLYGTTAPTPPNQNAEDFTSGPTGNAGAFQKYEMLGKTFNNFTTRSNGFLVYLTIGYFEVMNQSPYTETNRPILGKELGTDDGNLVRNKFFAVVDRTNLTREYQNGSLTGKQGQAPVYLPFEPEANPALPYPGAAVNDPVLASIPPGIPARVNVATPVPNSWIMVRIPATGQTPFNPPAAPPPTRTNSVTGSYDGVQWTLYDDTTNSPPTQIILESNGQKLEVAVRLPDNAYNYADGTAQIMLVAKGGPGPTPFPPNFRIERGATMRIVDPGRTVNSVSLPCEPANPGPQPGFNYKAPRYAPVVRYAEQIQ